MTDLFQNKYRVPSARASWWDYGWSASYFITICVRDHVCSFGSIVDGIMILSETGKIAEDLWKMIPEKFSFIKLDEFVVMPNHIHGILTIEKTGSSEGSSYERTKGITGENRMMVDNISKVVRWYKGRTTFEVRKILASFEWQTRFHDHIIRDEKSYNNIRRYIIENPKRWQDDKFYL